jgi:NADPH-dependent 2,4-dienoyl-CoA reductase/sulfur reductase-like enzyme
MTCVYNPVTRRETTWAALEPAARPRRLVVVGAGPAGMEAALTAAQRGHQVVVFEREGRVGGQVWAGAASPLRRAWARIAEFYERQAVKGLFAVRFNVEATAASVLAERPDAVVVATGSQPVWLEIAGGPAALTVHAALAGAADRCRRVVVFDREGFNRALVVADYLSARGTEVEFVSALPQVSGLVEGMMREEVLEQLAARPAGTRVRFAAAEEIAGWDAAGVLRLRSTRTAEERILAGVDAVVAAVGSTPVNALAHALRGQVPELHVIGDANLPQTVEEATYQGARVGRLV